MAVEKEIIVAIEFGSSKIMTSGLLMSTSATPKRWRMPLEYFPVFLPAYLVIPTRSSSRSAFSRASSRGMPFRAAV